VCVVKHATYCDQVLLYGVGTELAIAKLANKISNPRIGYLLEWQIAEEWQDAFMKAIAKYLYTFTSYLTSFRTS
jgi:hypothetical protein